MEGKIRRVSELLEEYKRLGGSDKKECLRRLYNEIDALFRTSPIALKKPTPVEEAGHDSRHLRQHAVQHHPQVYRRFDDWVWAIRPVSSSPLAPRSSTRAAGSAPTATVTERHRQGEPRRGPQVLRSRNRRPEEATRTVGRNLTMEAETTPPSAELKSLWSHQKEMSERLTDKAALISTKEMHRAVMLVMADRLHYTIERDADLMYHSCDDFLADLKVWSSSPGRRRRQAFRLRPAAGSDGRPRPSASSMVEMEFRQHSVVHARALADIREHGLHGERGELQPMTHEVLDTFRALGAIQKRNGLWASPAATSSPSPRAPRTSRITSSTGWHSPHHRRTCPPSTRSRCSSSLSICRTRWTCSRK